MDRDDAGIGRVLTRREVIALLGASGAMLLAGCLPGQEATTTGERAAGTPSGGATSATGTGERLCVVRPEQTEGPYFVDEMLDRSDLRTDPTDRTTKPGAPLELTLAVSRLANGRCTPLPGAIVDLWHCDALGAYSGVRDPFFDTAGKKFLRGYQRTDAQGLARFVTIYPGWYPGRAVHIHFKIRSAPDARPGFEFTSQLYFDDALTDRVHAEPPYAEKGPRDVRNERDGIYRDGGTELMLATTPRHGGYAARFDVALQLG